MYNLYLNGDSCFVLPHPPCNSVELFPVLLPRCLYDDSSTTLFSQQQQLVAEVRHIGDHNLYNMKQQIKRLIACCYGVARFIVQNKQATTLWSGSRDLYRV